MDNPNIKSSKIDPRIMEVLGGDDVAEQVMAIADEMSLTNKQVDNFSQSILFLFQKKISLENYPYVLQNELNVSEPDALKAATYVGKAFVIPNTAEFFPEGDMYFEKWKTLAREKGASFGGASTAPAPAPESTATPPTPKSPASTATTADIRPASSQPSAAPVSTKPAPATFAPAPSTTAKPAAPAVFKLTSTDVLKTISPRALDKEPQDAGKLTERMKEEIQNISNNSGAKRPDIIAAWKDSQLYHTYVDMGNDSMQQGKAIPEVLAERKASGKPYLTEAQFHAVSDISRQLLS